MRKWNHLTGSFEREDNFENGLDRHDRYLLEHGPLYPKPWDYNDSHMMKIINCSQRDYQNLIKAQKNFDGAKDDEIRREEEINYRINLAKKPWNRD